MSSALRRPSGQRPATPGWQAARSEPPHRDDALRAIQQPTTATPSPPSSPPTLRELRTSDATPNAPRLELLFGRERPPPARSLLIWDPAAHWPMLSLAALAGAPPDGTRPLHEVRMRREGQVEPLLCVQHLRLASADGELGVMTVIAPPVDAVSLRLALALLEQADHALLLAGSAFDADLQRRVRAQVVGATWHGPPLLLGAPADRPSRAQRLRRLDWPAELRTEVIELPRQAGPDWTRQLVEHILSRASPSGRDAPTAAAGPLSTRGAAVEPVRSPSALPPSSIEAALDLVMATAGIGGAAWWLPGAPAQRICRGSAAQSPAVLATAEAMWAFALSRATESPLEALAWQTTEHHLTVLPVDPPAGGLLLAIADPRSGDPAAVRWQLAVARNALG